MKAVLHRRFAAAGELIAYSRAHLRASVSLNRSMFETDAIPDHLVIIADGLREPRDPRALQVAKAARAKRRAENAQTLAASYHRIAKKHAARLERLRRGE